MDGDHVPPSSGLSRDDVRAQLAQLAEQRSAEKLAANWQEHYAKLDRPRQAWADLLMREPWHWFVTLTFKPHHEGRGGGIHPEKAGKAFGIFSNKLNEQLYGRHFRKTRGELGGVVWANGTEFHKDGRIHFHALVGCIEGDLSQYARRLSYMDWWHSRFGYARIEPPDSQDDVCGYVSKYVVKGGEVDFSSNFGRVRPPSLWLPQEAPMQPRRLKGRRVVPGHVEGRDCVPGTGRGATHG